MKRNTRITILLFVILLILALPATALATNKHWVANLQGFRPATGSIVLGSDFGGTGLRYQGVVRSLSGNPTAIHIRAGADDSILVTICSGANCPANNATFTGSIKAAMFTPGVDPVDFMHKLDAGETYVDVATEAHPGGEIWGTLVVR